MATIKSKRNNRISFVNGTVKYDKIVYPVMDIVKVPYDGIKFYGDVFLRMTQLSPSAIMFYHYTIMGMSDAMITLTDAYQREMFLQYTHKLGHDYQDVTVKRAIKDLVDYNLLIPMNRSRYKINPEFCYRGKEQERKQHIALIKRNTNINGEYIFNQSKEQVERVK